MNSGRNVKIQEVEVTGFNMGEGDKEETRLIPRLMAWTTGWIEMDLVGQGKNWGINKFGGDWGLLGM